MGLCPSNTNNAWLVLNNLVCYPKCVSFTIEIMFAVAICCAIFAYDLQFGQLIQCTNDDNVII